MTWFFLALVCAFSLATADTLIKRCFPGSHGVDLLVVRIVVTGFLLSPLVLHQPLPSVPPVFWGWLTVLVPCELAALLLYMIAIRDHPLHLTLPYLAFTPVLNLVIAYVVLGELVTPAGLCGVVLVVAGAYLLNLDRLADWRTALAPLGGIFQERGSRLMLGVASIYSFTSVGGKAAMGYTTPEMFGPFYYLMIALVLSLILVVVRPASFKVLYHRPSASLAVAALMAVMVVTHFLAIARVEVAYFISVKRTSLLFGILYGALLFGERDVVRHLLAGSLMVAGVAVIVGQ